MCENENGSKSQCPSNIISLFVEATYWSVNLGPKMMILFQGISISNIIQKYFHIYPTTVQFVATVKILSIDSIVTEY
jgi:hypothetical protein